MSIGASIKQYVIWFLAILASIFTLSFVVTLFKRWIHWLLPFLLQCFASALLICYICCFVRLAIFRSHFTTPTVYWTSLFCMVCKRKSSIEAVPDFPVSLTYLHHNVFHHVCILPHIKGLGQHYVNYCMCIAHEYRAYGSGQAHRAYSILWPSPVPFNVHVPMFVCI